MGLGKRKKARQKMSDFFDPWKAIRDLTESLNLLINRVELLEDRIKKLEEPHVTVTVHNNGMSFEQPQDEPPV